MEPVEPVCALLSGVLVPLEDADGLLCVAAGFAPLLVEELAPAFVPAGLFVLEAVPGVEDCDCEDCEPHFEEAELSGEVLDGVEVALDVLLV
jgi:hypothetical protein